MQALRCLVVLFLSFLWFAGPARAQEATHVPASRGEVMLSFALVVKKAAPAVVNIYTSKIVRQRAVSPLFNDPFFQQFFGGNLPQGVTRKRMENALGSGVIVKPTGVIVTSNHVIAGADEITVVLSDRREFEAKLQLADDKTDLAVLVIDPKGEALPFLEIKDSDDAQVGDLVLAIGNPFGVGQTVTSGILSATARTNVDITDINYFLQTDAAINPGNSGGALVSMDGKLLGINSAIYSRNGGNMGLGFAVPSNMVRFVVEGGKQAGKKLLRSWTGIQGQPVTNDMANSLGLSRPMGFLVNAVHTASPATKAGLRVGDVITAINGREIDDPESFAYRIATQPLGSEVKLDILQNGQKNEITIKLVPPPEVPAREETQIKGANPLSGTTIANLSPAVSEEYGLRGSGESGVVITSIAAGAVASRMGLEKGDVILKINNRDMRNVRDVAAIVDTPSRGWIVVFRRNGEVAKIFVRS